MSKILSLTIKAIASPAVRGSSVALALLSAAPLLLNALPAHAQSGGPSFSCARAPEGGVEQMICSDAALSRQDRVLATAFSSARAAVHGSEGLGELLESQRLWLTERSECADLRTGKGLCIESRTAARIEELEQWASLRTNPARASRRPEKTGTNKNSRPPQGPSFDCTKTTNTVERAICANRSLSILDREMASLYRRATIRLAPSETRSLATEQREFLANRNQCSRRTSDRTACIETAYEMRNLRLGEWLNGKPAN